MCFQELANADESELISIKKIDASILATASATDGRSKATSVYMEYSELNELGARKSKKMHKRGRRRCD